MKELIGKLRDEKWTLEDSFNTASPKECLNMSMRILDINSELDILRQARKIINKYDMHTKKESAEDIAQSCKFAALYCKANKTTSRHS